jgi:alkylhydroperoxidase family enzyme
VAAARRERLVTVNGPRIAPVPRGDIPDDVRAALKGWLRPDATEIPEPLDTLARHPDLARAYLTFSRHLLASSLPPRARELVVLRTAVVCGSVFEREQHEIIARREGVDDESIVGTAEGPDASGWAPADAALMRAVDQLLADWTVDDGTWVELAESYDVHQLMDIVFTVGGYSTLAMAFNALGTHSDR